MTHKSQSRVRRWFYAALDVFAALFAVTILIWFVVRAFTEYPWYGTLGVLVAFPLVGFTMLFGFQRITDWAEHLITRKGRR